MLVVTSSPSPSYARDDKHDITPACSFFDVCVVVLWWVNAVVQVCLRRASRARHVESCIDTDRDVSYRIVSYVGGRKSFVAIPARGDGLRSDASLFLYLRGVSTGRSSGEGEVERD